MLNISYVALQELIMYFHALIFMFGLSYALKEKSHVKIDIIYNSLNKKNQYFISMLGTIIFIIPTSLFIVYSSMDMVTQSWSLLEGSSEAGGLDLVFILKSVIPITGFLIFLQALSDIIKYMDKYKT
jgi:TRAP-type mannitol/chloroaromatic compound transport system permease small subunit